MMICPQCRGGLYLKFLIEELEIGKGSGTFTAPTQGNGARVCPSCLGNGYTTQAGT